MAKHLETGKRGEQLATEYLETKGYKILERNWRHSYAEVDIIARHGDILVFVEVKTRSNDRFSKPEDAIDEKKEDFIASVAPVYMEQIGHEWEIRFDFISVVIPKSGKVRIRHMKDAFWGMF